MENSSEEREDKKGRDGMAEREYVIRLRVPKFSHLVRGETLGHLRAARREALLAVRGIIDAA
ncbi:MAG: hypothetical protein Q7O66_14435, partial [Dehalococcoidia bacterium]|nr:hypothetical protein [Dehalococcoidia bacterium]